MSFKFTFPQRKNKVFRSMKEFTFKRQIGSGAFSTVHEALHIKTKRAYAVKKIELSRIEQMDQENIVKEIEVHSLLNHKNIIKLFDFLKEGDTIFLILEFCRKGNLFRYLNGNLAKSEDELKKFFKQTCTAISYMHGLGFINRDLKPENILLDDQHNVKVCDFGWACSLEEDEYRRLKAGTCAYMSPECLMGKLQDKETDIWSLGILLYELYYNREPFDGKSVKEQLKKIKEGKIRFKTKTDEKLKKLVMALLQFQPKKRPSFEFIFESSFLCDFDENLVGPYGSRIHPQLLKKPITERKRPDKQEEVVAKYKSNFRSFVNFGISGKTDNKDKIHKSSFTVKTRDKNNTNTIEPFRVKSRKTVQPVNLSKMLERKRKNSLARRINHRSPISNVKNKEADRSLINNLKDNKINTSPVQNKRTRKIEESPINNIKTSKFFRSPVDHLRSRKISQLSLNNFKTKQLNKTPLDNKKILKMNQSPIDNRKVKKMNQSPLDNKNMRKGQLSSINNIKTRKIQNSPIDNIRTRNISESSIKELDIRKFNESPITNGVKRKPVHSSFRSHIKARGLQQTPTSNLKTKEHPKELKPKREVSLNIYEQNQKLRTPIKRKATENDKRKSEIFMKSFYSVSNVPAVKRNDSVSSVGVLKRMPSRGKTIINLSSKEFNIVNKKNFNPYKNLYKHNARDLSSDSICYKRIDNSPTDRVDRTFNMYERIKQLQD